MGLLITERGKISSNSQELKSIACPDYLCGWSIPELFSLYFFLLSTIFFLLFISYFKAK